MSVTTSPQPLVSAISQPNWVQRHPLAAYFGIAFAGTWLLVIPLAMSTGFNLFPMPDALLMLLFVISAYPGPLLAALVVTRATEGKAGVRQLLKSAVQWRVGPGWYLVAIFAMLLVWLAAYSIPYRGAPVFDLLANPLLLATAFLPWILFGIFVPSLGEEVGWRGFALPRLQKQYGPFLGTLILGALHGLWHLPALLTAFMGPLAPEQFLPFILTALAGTFLYTFVINHARGSVFIAILMHASSNAASRLLSEIIPTDAVLPAPFEALSPDWLNAIAFGLVACALVILTRGRLGYRPEPANA